MAYIGQGSIVVLMQMMHKVELFFPRYIEFQQ